MPKRLLDIPHLRKFGLRTTIQTLRRTAQFVENQPRVAFEPRPHPTSGKLALRVDLFAEDHFFGALAHCAKRRYAGVARFAEETERTASPSQGLSVLVDAVDGTDLLERGLSNWCTAVLFFDPSLVPGHRIIAAFVGFAVWLPKQPQQIRTTVYYASSDRDGAWVSEGEEERPARGPSAVTALTDASICFYGQKISRLAAFAKGPLSHHVHSQGEGAAACRLYNFGGNPMLARMVDPPFPGARWIDAVLEITDQGQLAHDVAPGAYIALKAGATIKDPTGTSINTQSLEDFLIAGGQRLRYVAASTTRLCDVIVECCRWTDSAHPGRRTGDRPSVDAHERRRQGDPQLNPESP